VKQLTKPDQEALRDWLECAGRRTRNRIQGEDWTRRTRLAGGAGSGAEDRM